MESVRKNYCIQDGTKNILKWDMSLWSDFLPLHYSAHMQLQFVGDVLVQQQITPYHYSEFYLKIRYASLSFSGFKSGSVLAHIKSDLLKNYAITSELF